jgi:Mycolic acid cyclopropane synthetase
MTQDLAIGAKYSPAGWWSVDAATDPDAFVHYLDVVGALETIKRMKRQTYDLLRVEPGHHLLDVGCGLGQDVQARPRPLARRPLCHSAMSPFSICVNARRKRRTPRLKE